MNVDDIKDVLESNNYLEDIFKRQWELIEKYHPIEHRILGVDKLNIDFNEEFHFDDAVYQLKLKEHLWRVVEEVAESYEVVYNQEDHKIHQIEELGDALHFLVETMIMIKIKPEDLKSFEEIKEDEIELDSGVDLMYNLVFYHLCITGNCLKNKLWKRTQVRTDKVRLIKCITEAYESLIELFLHLQLEPKDIYEVYMKKSYVNSFRIDTNY